MTYPFFKMAAGSHIGFDPGNVNVRSAFKDSRGRTSVLQKYCKTENGLRGHIFRGSSGINALLILESKISGVKARGRPVVSYPCSHLAPPSPAPPIN